MSNIKLLLRKLNTFIKLNNTFKIEFIKAFIYTGIARAVILFMPFNKLAKKIGKQKIESPENVENEILRIAGRIGDVVIQASWYTPWESKCLVQALTAQRMLKEKGISTTLYLGVKKDNNSNMLAHAWTRCGTYYVTGGYNKDGFAIVAKFTT